MPNHIAVLQQLQVGSDWSATPPVGPGVYSNGILLFEDEAQGGLIQLPSDGWYRLPSLFAKFDGAAHGAAAVTGAITLRAMGYDMDLDSFSNEENWIWRGGPLIVPPNSQILITMSGAAVTTQRQMMTVILEKYRGIDPDGVIRT